MATSTAPAETTRDTDGTAKRTTRPQPDGTARDVADQMEDWLREDTTRRIVGRFRL